MECKNCNCSINHGNFCSKACHLAKIKEDSRLNLTSNINALLEAKGTQEGMLEQLEVANECHDDHMKFYGSTSKAVKYGAELKKEVKQCRLELKIIKLSIIIGISIRDKKGTYPQLKSKYSETINDYLSVLDTSGELCEVAEGMKHTYESFEFMWGNNVELTEQIKIWRKQRKQGVIEIHAYNNHTKQIDGTDWHILVVQQTGDDLGPIDTLGFGFDNGAFVVSGFIYCFKSIQNRDATYKYVMGLS
jgi:hypothetical protein